MNTKKEIKTKVSVIDTLLNIPVGNVVKFTVKDMLLTSVRSAVSRLNAEKPNRFILQTDEFGISYTIQRLKR